MTVEISSQGVIYFQCPVINRVASPVTDVVKIAFLPAGSKPDGTETWNTGSWDASSVAPIYLAQVLAGKSPGVVLLAGSYDGYVKITDSPEAPVIGPYPVSVY